MQNFAHSPRSTKPERRSGVLLWQGSGRMAALAFPGGVLVEKNAFALKFTVILMATGAWHVLVQALERELGAFVVIKE